MMYWTMALQRSSLVNCGALEMTKSKPLRTLATMALTWLAHA